MRETKRFGRLYKLLFEASSCLLLTLWLMPATAELLDYEIDVGPWISEHSLMSFFLMPEQEITISLMGKHKGKSFRVQKPDGALSAPMTSYRFKAATQVPKAEIFIQPEGLTRAHLKLFTLTPATDIKNGKLNGYTIGKYPAEAYQGLAIYQPPKGFLAVSQANQDEWISPHYQLKQFLCKQVGGYPKYVVLQTRLLRKLEFLTQAAIDQGLATEGFVVMSGYRTPFYNAAIKNKLYSRHQWGGAADIYIDENPRDGVMDDLNKDGKINTQDAKVLADLVESYYKTKGYQPFVGGLGLYSSNAAHGPFIHVDVRGFKARW